MSSLPFDNQSTSLCKDSNSLFLQKNSHFIRAILTLWSTYRSQNTVIFRNELFSQFRTLLHAKHDWVKWKSCSYTIIHPPTTSSPSTPVRQREKRRATMALQEAGGSTMGKGFPMAWLAPGSATTKQRLRGRRVQTALQHKTLAQNSTHITGPLAWIEVGGL